MNEMESEISMAKTKRLKDKRPEISTPTATADHIYRRLLLPSALLRSPPPPTIASLKEKTTMKKKKKKKLEDYLDPALLAEISAKIRRAKKMKDFGIESNWRKSEALVVDLRDDSEPPMFDRNGDGDGEESCSTTVFQHFEKMASTL